MPRLKAETHQRNLQEIERAAACCLIGSGYHGVSMREIAEKADVSLGNLYNYYPDKLSLFRAILKTECRDFLGEGNPVVGYFLRSRFPDDLPALARAIESSVDRHADYFKLIYIDVVEFSGKHVRELFSDLDSRFRATLDARFRELGMLGPERDIDPAFALIAIYLAFYQYFMLTRLFGAKNVYGSKTDSGVVADLIHLLERGIAHA